MLCLQRFEYMNEMYGIYVSTFKLILKFTHHVAELDCLECFEYV